LRVFWRHLSKENQAPLDFASSNALSPPKQAWSPRCHLKLLPKLRFGFAFGFRKNAAVARIDQR